MLEPQKVAIVSTSKLQPKGKSSDLWFYCGGSLCWVSIGHPTDTSHFWSALFDTHLNFQPTGGSAGRFVSARERNRRLEGLDIPAPRVDTSMLPFGQSGGCFGVPFYLEMSCLMVGPPQNGGFQIFLSHKSGMPSKDETPIHVLFWGWLHLLGQKLSFLLACDASGNLATFFWCETSAFGPF